MTIEQLQKEMTTAMKEKNKFKKEVISSLLSTAKNMAIEKGTIEIRFFELKHQLPEEPERQEAPGRMAGVPALFNNKKKRYGGVPFVF